MYQIIKMILLNSIFMDYIDIQKLDKNGFTIHIIEIMLVLSLINGIVNLYDEKKFFIIEFLMIILYSGKQDYSRKFFIFLAINKTNRRLYPSSSYYNWCWNGWQ